MTSEKPGQVGQTLYRKLTDAFAPTDLQVNDDSHKHAGHVGARPEGETHFSVIITADAFNGQSRIDRQRMVYTCLKAELATRVHALSIKARTPAELSTE